MNQGLQNYLLQKRQEKEANKMIITEKKEEDQKQTQKIIPEEQPTKEQKVHTVPPIKKKIKKTWKDSYVLLGVSDPEPIPTEEKTKYKYKIRVDYKDDKGKKHSFNMKIGKKKELYAVDGISQEMARLKNSRFIKCTTPFDKNYFTIWLLNDGPDIFTNRANFMRRLKQ